MGGGSYAQKGYLKMLRSVMVKSIPLCSVLLYTLHGYGALWKTYNVSKSRQHVQPLHSFLHFYDF